MNGPACAAATRSSRLLDKSLPTLTSSLSSNRPLAYRSEPYDPYIPGSNPNQPGGGPGPSASGSGAGGKANDKTAKIQQQIDDTVGIMRENITKVAERGERLDALQDKTGELRVAWGLARLASHTPPLLVQHDAETAARNGGVFATDALTWTLILDRHARPERTRLPPRRQPGPQADGAFPLTNSLHCHMLMRLARSLAVVVRSEPTTLAGMSRKRLTPLHAVRP